jgi:hypothetical protein
VHSSFSIVAPMVAFAVSSYGGAPSTVTVSAVEPMLSWGLRPTSCRTSILNSPTAQAIGRARFPAFSKWTLQLTPKEIGQTSLPDDLTGKLTSA